MEILKLVHVFFFGLAFGLHAVFSTQHMEGEQIPLLIQIKVIKTYELLVLLCKGSSLC